MRLLASLSGGPVGPERLLRPLAALALISIYDWLVSHI